MTCAGPRQRGGFGGPRIAQSMILALHVGLRYRRTGGKGSQSGPQGRWLDLVCHEAHNARRGESRPLKK